MSRLAECLLPLVDSDRDKAINQVVPLLDSFPQQFEEKWMSMLGKKIGLKNLQAADRTLVTELLEIMRVHQADYTNTMNLLTDQVMQKKVTLESVAPQERDILVTYGLRDWFGRWQNRLQQEDPVENIASLMRASNPVVIPRNHHVEAVLQQSQNAGNAAAVERLLHVLRNPYRLTEDTPRFQDAPEPFAEYMTFCGT